MRSTFREGLGDSLRAYDNQRVRRLLVAVIVGMAFPAQADAARDYAPQGLSDTVTTAHFVVHYTSLRGNENAITLAAARRVAANAERVWSVEVDGWGYPAPLDDGDGRVDIDVFRFTSGYAGDAYPLSTHRRAWQFPGRIELNAAFATNLGVLGHEFFHVLQFGMFGRNARWLDESTARWSEHEADWPDGWPTALDDSYLAHPNMSLDCTAAECPAGTWDGGYERWLFWAFLAQRHGRTVVRDFYSTEPAWAASLAVGQPFSTTAALDSFLRARGSSLAQAFSEFAVANAARTYPAAAQVDGVVATRVALGAPTSVRVGHLAAEYLELARSTPCRGVRLHLALAAPQKADRPYLVFGTVAAPLTAFVDMQWNTCSRRTLIVIPNGSLTGDPLDYTLTASVRRASLAAHSALNRMS